MSLPLDIWERRAALDPERSFIVQAPAGSGKTELLIQRYLALLARVIQPESVLAITFTVKAAGEMRERVLDALRAAAGPEPDDENARLTYLLARQVLVRDRDSGWSIAENPSRLNIRTIDALCAAIAQRMPWLVRFGAMPGVTEQPDALYAQAARATLRMLEGHDRFGNAVERLVLHLDNDFRRAQAMLEALLPRREQWLRYLAGSDPQALREQMESTLSAIVDAGLSAARDKLPPLWRDEFWAVTRYAAAQRGVPVNDDFEGWRFIRGLLLKTAGEWRDKVDTRNGFPANAKDWKNRFARLALQLRGREGLLEALQAIETLPSPRFNARQWEFLEALLQALPAAAAQLKIVFQQGGLVDFSEVAQAAARGLGSAANPSDLGFALGGQFEHILVDEVQDTSASQVELLMRLTVAWEPGDGHTIFLVGDPMQSIYRFRDADVGLFLKIREHGLGNPRPEPIQLTANFRSRPEIVQWVNTAFERLFPAQEDTVLGAVRYSASTAFRAELGDAAVTLHPFFGSDPTPEAIRAVDLAVEAHRHGTVAILVRARTHVPEIAAEFKRRGVRYRAVEQDLLGERPAVRDLLALTRALLHPADRPAWLAILRAPWCGLALADLHRIGSGNPETPVWEIVRHPDLVISEPTRLVRFREAMSIAMSRVRRVPLRECVEQAWEALHGPECLEDAASQADARRFLGLIEKLDQGGEIADLDLLERRVERLFAEPDPESDESLQLMTIHKAKGLQFDTVIVPGLGRESARDDRQLILWAEVPGPVGVPELLIAPVEPEEDEPDPIYSYLRHLERRKGDYEAARLLYVAATRARERLHLLGQVAVKDEEIQRPRAGSLLHLLWPVVEQEFRNAYDSGQVVAERPVAAPRGLELRRLPVTWLEQQPPPIDPRPEQTAEPVQFEWVGDTLRHVGTVVHAWLQRIVEEGVEQWDGARIGSRRTAIQTSLEALGVPPDDMRDAVRLVTQSLVQTLSDQRGRWILKRRANDSCEFAAGIPVDGVIHHAVIDRTFVEDGTRWIIDYKTSSHEGSNVEEFLNGEHARYKDQLDRYARLFGEFEDLPARLGLYFPLLGGWREWEDESKVFKLTAP